MNRIISYEQYETIINNVVNKLLDPEQFGGPWFNGSSGDFEEWAGDVFSDVILHTLKEVGIDVNFDEV